MPQPSNKKLTILYTLLILKDYSDSNHLLSQSAIANLIELNYGINCERKSIAANIDSLIDAGFDIIKTKAGCYCAGISFDESEIRFLIDAIFSSRSIDGKQAQLLAQKLMDFLSIYKRKSFKYVYKTTEINRANNKSLFYNIDVINEAIKQGKQIKFKYERFSVQKEKENKKEYVVNPYFLINTQGKYFLVCNNKHFDSISNYRLDKIKNISILNSESKEITNIEGFEKGLDIATYINENIYMFSSKTISASIRIHKELATQFIEEWFGKNVRFYYKNNELFADIKANETSLIYWCLQYGDHIELISPKETRNKIKEKIKQMQMRYIDDGK